MSDLSAPNLSRDYGNPRMLYTHTPSTHQGDRIRFYPSATAAQAADSGQAVLAVAVRFDAPGRRVVPLWTDPDMFDPTWTTPAELHADDSITARGPIPARLFGESGPESLLGPSPQVQEKEDRGAIAERTDPGRGGVPLCVLVVEDEPLVAHALVRLLWGWGYTTLEATDGGAALDQVRKAGSQLSLILLDIMLPVLDGVEVARQVRADWPDLPIVACSAALNADLEEDLGRLGVREFLHKPFRVEALRAALRR